MRAVESFVEKPDAATAARYVAEGYLWNSGIFLFRADGFLCGARATSRLWLRRRNARSRGPTIDLGFLRLDPAALPRRRKKSIDYAVMEKTDHAAVVEARFRWSDIGSWDASFDDQRDATSRQRRARPRLANDAENCLVHSETALTAVVGVEDLVVVSTPDAVLVLPRDRAQEVKDLVGSSRALAAGGDRPSARHRPWGSFDSIDRGDRFQVKRIVVRPGGKLSLQKHHHRAEHWVVVRGTAEVTIGWDQGRA